MGERDDLIVIVLVSWGMRVGMYWLNMVDWSNMHWLDDFVDDWLDVFHDWDWDFVFSWGTVNNSVESVVVISSVLNDALVAI